MDTRISRNIKERAQEYLSVFPVVLIEGARQVGKSTLAHLLAPTALTLNLDIPEIADSVQADQMGAIEQSPDSTLVIDEIQYLPQLTRAIKASVDRYHHPGRFLLTGSASLLRIKGIQDSLAGRVGRLQLYGFSQGELKGVKEDFVSHILAHVTSHTAERDKPVREFHTSLTRNDYIEICAAGAYPDPSRMNSRLRGVWFDNYTASIIHRDLGELQRKVDPHRAESLLRILAANQAAELVKAHIARSTGIPESTVPSYLDLLNSVQLVEFIRPWTANLMRREIGKKKSVVLDSGLAMRLAGVTPKQLTHLQHQETFGHILEGFVISELLRQKTWSDTEFNLMHYRESNGTEVDVIIETGDGDVIGIEVKAASSYSAKQFHGLKKIQEALGGRFRAGIVLGTAPHGYRYAPGLYGLPISALWEFENNNYTVKQVQE